MAKHLQLSKKEVAAVIDYVFQHVRAANGTARKVYEKMQEFLSFEGPEQMSLKFKEKRRIAGNN